jgi:DICT domain-containing protein
MAASSIPTQALVAESSLVTAEAAPDDETLLTIGELAGHTGLTPQQVRMWETRYGFPEPIRLPSGHRRYTGAHVRAVQRVLHERDRGMRLEQAIESAQRAEDVVFTGSVYAALAQRHPALASYTLTKRTLLALSWAIEDEATASASRGVLVGTFQRGRYFGQSQRRWEELARTARCSLAMADFEAHDDESAPAKVALPPDSPLLREWIVVHDSPTLAATLVAWELPGQEEVADAERHFEALWSVDGKIVRDAAVVSAQAAAALGSVTGRRALEVLEELPSPAPASMDTANAVFNRMVAYTDGTTLRGRRPR